MSFWLYNNDTEEPEQTAELFQALTQRLHERVLAQPASLFSAGQLKVLLSMPARGSAGRNYAAPRYTEEDRAFLNLFV